MDQDCDRIGLRAIGAAGAPDAQLPRRAVTGEAGRQHVVPQRIEMLGMAEERRLADRQFRDEAMELSAAAWAAFQKIEIGRK